MKLAVINKEKGLIKSMSINAILKPISMFVSLAYTPILLSYLGDEKYGVWTTLLSVMNWLTIFDFGIGGGFRNILSVKIANNDENDIKSVTATAYATLGIIVSIIFIICSIIIGFTNWQLIFNTQLKIKSAIFFVLIFVCLNFIFGLTNSIFYASQKAQYVPMISLGLQLLNLAGIVFLSKEHWNVDGELTNVAVLYCLANIIVNIIALIFLWRKNAIFIPHITLFDKQYVRPIFNYGFKLFFLQISGIILFATDNMIITQLFSPSSVTPYSITQNCFNIVNIFFGALLAPFWSRYTIENEKKNFGWIKKSLKLQLVLWGLFTIGMILVGATLNDIYYIWLGRSLDISYALIFTMALLKATEMFTAIFSNFLNGVSHINVQLIISVLAAFLNIPLSVFLAKYLDMGVVGVCMATLFCQLLGCIFLPIDTVKYLYQRENKNGKKA